jgi:cbb3-type cytochrome c oxidase subunit III
MGSRKPILWTLTVSMAIILGLTFWSQSSILAKEAASPQTAPPVAAAPAPPAAASNGQPATTTTASAQAGQTVYSQNCSSCHGATGAGTAGAFPPLANNPYVTGDAKAVILTVLNGKQGAITVNGQSFNGQMPAWKANLSNKDIANVINYIRTGLGNNKASEVKLSQVAALKK